jgi:hypothetical protein
MNALLRLQLSGIAAFLVGQRWSWVDLYDPNSLNFCLNGGAACHAGQNDLRL